VPDGIAHIVRASEDEWVRRGGGGGDGGEHLVTLRIGSQCGRDKETLKECDGRYWNVAPRTRASGVGRSRGRGR
jgi:hypothetical protein